jgi:hypothetical protein
MARRRPNVRFNKLKLIVKGGEQMSHKDIMRVWAKMLWTAKLDVNDRAAMDVFSQALLDYYEENADLEAVYTPEELVAHVLRLSIPLNWETAW